MTKLISILVISLFISKESSAQGTANITLTIPKDLDKSKLVIFFDDGKERRKVSEEFSNNKLSFSQKYYSRYAAFSLAYFDKGGKGYGKTFFVRTKPAKISVLPSDTLASPFKTCQFINATDFKEETEKLLNYTAAESDALRAFSSSYGDVYQKRDSSLIHQYEVLDKALKEKELDFIKKYGHTYYSFWYFNRVLATSPQLDKNRLLTFYNNVFPEALRRSTEGTYITSFLDGSINTMKNHLAPDFNATDIKGNQVALQSFHNKSYLLLVFGASWCVPCMKEIPDLLKINNAYMGKLPIVYATLDESKEAFLRIIKEKKMDWINIFFNWDMINAYGGYKGVPQVYLIDKAGKIIYNRSEDSDVGLTKLNGILKGINFN